MLIMLADDEPSIHSVVKRILDDAGYELCVAYDGVEAISVWERDKPDLIILDVMMPRLDGFQVCKALRDKGCMTPILFLSAKGDLVDKGVGFTSGGDDYLVKPFSPEELLMRIKAHLRQHDRFTQREQQVMQVGTLQINTRRRQVTNDGNEIMLTPKEYEILEFLAQCKGEIVTREQLIRKVWGDEFVGETSSVSVFMRRIREKIETDPSHPVLLKTVRNVGYMMGSEE